MTSCGLLLEGPAPYNNKKQSKRELGKQQLRTGMNIEVAGSGCVLTEARGHLLLKSCVIVHPYIDLGAC